MEDHPPMDPGREAPNQWSRAGGTSEVEPGRIPWRTTFQLIQGVRHQFSGEDIQHDILGRKRFLHPCEFEPLFHQILLEALLLHSPSCLQFGIFFFEKQES
ncbi:uncharacterized protein [Zea mays]|uniref:uncharacterized protein isoform X1 n=1 Tax=Zea mays TaxID=4577 RepID=UPI0009A9D72A|nr:uncharacterized protein LOC109944815 isoform X1 [Zea mays]|eukprot:XP_020405799.1 uncharacterized protein LOC109944815 isoform X1 [Zea mays]